MFSTANPAFAEVGIDVMSAANAPSDRVADRVGRHSETAAFGVAGALAAKEAATKVVGGRPPGSSLLDLVVEVDVELPPGIAALLGDLGVGPATVRPWQFQVSPHLRATVAAAGGCPVGRGVIGTTAAGDLVALCLGQPGAAQ